MRVFVLGLASLGGGCALAAAVWWVRQRAGNSADEEPSKVLSVNYHLTRRERPPFLPASVGARLKHCVACKVPAEGWWWLVRVSLRADL